MSRTTNNGTTRLLQRLLIGNSFQNAIKATAVGVVLVVVATVVQFGLIESLSLEYRFGWSIGGLLSISLLACLVVVAAAYAYSGGGLIDCWAILLVPLFITFTTVISVAPTTDGPVPFWKWSYLSYPTQTIIAVIDGALLWGAGLGVIGFLLGMVFREMNRIRSNRSQTNRAN